MARTVPDKFLVAFSLAGEQRDIVRSVAEAVERELGESNVFYDEWYESYIAGADADLKLQGIYGEQCVLAVVCVSERYGGKPWTQAEHRAIRARHMKAEAPRDQLGILPIRVGDGDVKGILFNAIVPDIRGRSADEAAKLITDRLRLMIPELGGDKPPLLEWPESPPPLVWPMADLNHARQAFEQLLSREASFRLLPLRGPSGVGKSEITRQMLGNALQVPDIACGRFDFKGTTGMDNELRAFAGHLDVAVPPTDLPVNQRLGRIINALKQRVRPTLLVFDTYEAAGDAQDWVENQLLVTVVRADWLRVVVAGQNVPERAAAILGTVYRPPIELEAPQPEDWFDSCKDHKTDVTLDFVRRAHKYCSGKPSVLAELLGRT